MEKEKLRLARELGYEPTYEQLAAAIGISAKKLMTLIQSSQDLLSLDMSVGDSGGMTLGGMIRDDTSEDPESRMLSQELLQELHRIISELNEREQRVMQPPEVAAELAGAATATASCSGFGVAAEVRAEGDTSKAAA